MKWRGLALLLFAFLVGLVPTASAQTPVETVTLMFANHRDFGCVKYFTIDLAHLTVTKNGTPPMAYNPQISAFAKERNLDEDWATCYYWVWLFDRDVNAKHYANRNGITEADRTALYYADLNEVIYDLGGQPAWRFILPNGRPESGHFQKYPDRYLGFFD
jgi:hypothetical protein